MITVQIIDAFPELVTLFVIRFDSCICPTGENQLSALPVFCGDESIKMLHSWWKVLHE